MNKVMQETETVSFRVGIVYRSDIGLHGGVLYWMTFESIGDMRTWCDGLSGRNGVSFVTGTVTVPAWWDIADVASVPTCEMLSTFVPFGGVA
jgi:hypothetical protein